MQGHDFMETSIEQIPTLGQLQLTIQVSANVHYSAAAARRIVGRFVAEEIGYLLRASEPTLVVSDRIRWRVPVTLAYPGVARLGFQVAYHEATLPLLVSHLQAGQPVIAFVDTGELPH
jgi:hypothetical protein